MSIRGNKYSWSSKFITIKTWWNISDPRIPCDHLPLYLLFKKFCKMDIFDEYDR